MSQLTSAHYIRQLMAQHDIRFHKSLGQNFLIDDNVLHEIVQAAQLDHTTGVLEIGPGIGVLTHAVAEHAKKVVAIELDAHLLPILAQTLADYDNVHIIQGDALKVDLGAIIQEHFAGLTVKVTANLPYYITTPIVMVLLEKKLPISSIVIMVQKEVAQRMAASPGGKEYGALSVAVQYYTKPTIITTVPPESFIPQPKIDSMVIRLDVLPSPAVDVDEKKFFRVV
ncbi:MAG: 16S rRNA (adenine(1518)-N(6)/adenine(1519)-N(6))-dimethyltransferase RsmA, partial [Hyphomonadaceae bacterium]|nr:16S rRNA (adenine(1518)-N(6)/adenine(1519)-N(6))-dimethyltransferase RsmA [Clostridia bacterium]